MNKQKKETQTEFKTKCYNCTGTGLPTDPKGLIFNIRACAKSSCASWNHRSYK